MELTPSTSILDFSASVVPTSDTANLVAPVVLPATGPGGTIGGGQAPNDAANTQSSADVADVADVFLLRKIFEILKQLGAVGGNTSATSATSAACFVRCYSNAKYPVGAAWQDRCLSADEVVALLKTHPTANVGLLLGPQSGIIDLECDSPEAEETFKRLFPNGVATGCYQSKRGRHYLFRWNGRLADLPSVIKWQGLEFRLGSAGAIQSLIPPSSVDGSKREWVVPPTIIAPLPDAIVDLLLNLPRPKRKPHESAPVDNRLVRRVLAYCEQNSLVHLGVRYDPVTGVAFIDLLNCPFKPPENNKGAPAFIISDRISFHCFHASCCATKHLSDIEQLFGPIFPRIIVGPDLPRIVDESIAVLRSVVYQHDGELTEMVADPDKPPLCKIDNGAPRLRPLSVARLKVLSHFPHIWVPFSANYLRWASHRP